MADEKKDTGSGKRINQEQRLNYIGFEVFPGKPKDLFKSESEKDRLIEAAKARRTTGQTVREDCKLLEPRVTQLDRIVLTIACVAVLAALFLPWYSAYNEFVEETNYAAADTTTLAVADDSLAAVTIASDSVVLDTSLAMVATTDEPALSEEAAAGSTEDEVGDKATPNKLSGRIQTSENEEIIHGYVARKKIYREYGNLSGIGAFLALGSVGANVFSSGVVLMLSGILILLYTLLCLGLPVYTLYGIYGAKGSEDEKALVLKKVVRYNWIPILLLLVITFLSFAGGQYGFDAAAMFASLGDSYGTGAFLSVLSWGVFVSMAAFILIAVKGLEI